MAAPFLQRWIVRRANEMGYFPTLADAKRIRELADGRPYPPGGVERLFADAIRDYFGLAGAATKLRKRKQ